jgi:hypothetical protein
VYDLFAGWLVMDYESATGKNKGCNLALGTALDYLGMLLNQADRTPCVLCDSKPSLTPDHPSQRPRVTKPGACDACRTRDPDTYQTRVE